MFFRDKRKKQDRRVSVAGAPRSIPTIISSGLSVYGDLRTEGNIEIDGEVDGNIYCNIVTVRKDGTVKGNISAAEIFIDGSANGMIKGNHIFVAPGATVSGILFYDTLTVRDGASLNAQCKNLSELKEAKDSSTADTDQASNDTDNNEDFFEEMTLSSSDDTVTLREASDDFLYSESIGAEDDDEESAESELTAAEYDVDTDIYEKSRHAPDIISSISHRTYRIQSNDDHSTETESETLIFGGDSVSETPDIKAEPQRKELV